MKYYLDTEFNGFGGELLSLALFPAEPAYSLYLRVHTPVETLEPWVQENVWPIIDDDRADVKYIGPTSDWSRILQTYFTNNHDSEITIISDWPDDIKYMVQTLIVGPGKMIGVGDIDFSMKRVDSYKTIDLNKNKEIKRHNAWWDAKVLKEYFD